MSRLAQCFAVLGCCALACAAGGGAATRASAHGWIRADLHAVTQPAAIAGRFVLYVSSHRRLELVALDEQTGRTVWSHAASSSLTAPGEAPSFAAVGDGVYSFQPVQGAYARLVAWDAATGAERWHSDIGEFSAWPGVCPAPSRDICLSGGTATGHLGRQLRFAAATGAVLPGARVSDTGTGREVGEGLFDAEQRNPELLVAVEGSRTIWKRPLAAIFDLPGASTDWGWNFDRVSRVGLFVGSPGWKPARHGQVYTVRLTRAMTAGFRITDGAVVWRDRGSTFWCTYLPCPGAAEASYSSPGAGGAETLGVRLRSTGSLSGTMTSRVPHVSRDARATIEGFDLRTGRTRWRFAAGRNVALISNRLQPARLDADTIAIRDASGHLVALDLRSGSRRPLRPDAHGWCRAQILYPQSYRYPGTPAGAPSLYVGQPSLFPCTAGQRRLPTPQQAPAFVGGIGAAAHGLVAWADAAAVHAVPRV